jgi:hypothetical protein
LRASRSLIAAVSISMLAGACMTTERASFVASAGQEALIRDGRPAISSVKKGSLVLLSPSKRETAQGQRVGFVLAIQNRTNASVTFLVDEVEVVQTMPDGESRPIAVLKFEQLQREERNRQVAQAILVGLAAGANAAAAANSGYYRSNTTLYTPRGTYTATTTGYSPAAAAIASANASAQNNQMIDAAVAQGRANLAKLENEYIKDNTLLPNEWYGGLVGIESPVTDGDHTRKTYQFRIKVGGDVHVINVVQEPVRT